MRPHTSPPPPPRARASRDEIRVPPPRMEPGAHTRRYALNRRQLPKLEHAVLATGEDGAAHPLERERESSALGAQNPNEERARFHTPP